ncbi:MAG: hypothetical protein LRY38_00510 [Aeromonadaceae bacterium]|nr:hypothetical protein [Aeromonadaceae bacterium]
MPPIPGLLADFLQQHHVLSLATQDEDGLWAASCFYAVDLTLGDLLLLTSPATRHGAAMGHSPQVAGSISGQPDSLIDIIGVQFTALATCLEGPPARAARALYCQRHPLARLARHPIWRLRLQHLKLTCNRHVFGHKIHWHREAPQSLSQVVDEAGKSQ